MIPSHSERGLILAPLGRDAQVASSMLAEAHVRTVACASLVELVNGLVAGAGFAVVTEEALQNIDLRPLASWIGGQPEWSDFPFILLTQRGGGIERNPGAIRLLQTLGNVTFLERPFHPTTLVSLVQSALRGRRRQYEARTRLDTLAVLNETLEARVMEAIAERNILADIVETTNALVQVVDRGYRLIAVNRASAKEMQDVFGVRLRVGDSLLDSLSPVPDAQAAVRALWARALAGEEFTEIVEFATPAGRRFYEVKFNSLFDRSGERIGAFQFAYDVTRRIQDQEKLAATERALRQAQKLEAVGQLTGGVAHDFNNLLMAFSSGLDLLNQPLDADRRRRVFQGMRQAIDRGTSLTRQLLAFARRRPLAPKIVDLRIQLLGMHEILQRALRGDVQVEMAFGDDLWRVEVDPGELELAILNICVNARDAMPDGGRIFIEARNTVNELGATRRDMVTLSIRDTGVGMSKEVQARAFEPFFTTKEVGKGSGLGLAQVYGFVTQSNGNLLVESDVGKGTTVHLTLPRSRKLPESAGVPARAADAAMSNGSSRRHDTLGNVMLVEDDSTVAALTVEMLDSIGYSVVHVNSAAEALKALSEGRKIDVVFSDVMMPGGMSGVDLAREIRKRRADLPVLLTTGYIEVARSAMTEGLEVLVKPYELETLAQTLDAHIASRASAPIG